MIISAGRRSDIPAFHSEWLFEKLRVGSVAVSSPRNPRVVRTVSLAPDDVDCLVLWSKNPAPMLGKLCLLAPRPFYFHFTLNDYEPEIEPNVPPLAERIETFKRLSGAVGHERVIWRYDPILSRPGRGVEYHVERFARLARSLSAFTGKVIISFMDFYAKTRGAVERFSIEPMSLEEQRRVAREISSVFSDASHAVAACAEEVDLSEYGITSARCVDPKLVQKLSGRPVPCAKDKGQRPLCGCAQSVDISAYGTCRAGCVYCYAR
ncbi:MAG: DUF1848 domain-containing protein [Synergistaceae bacterium]|nr:DUF1848 domain-containing protein [Synergistaceae bacterium]